MTAWLPVKQRVLGPRFAALGQHLLDPLAVKLGGILVAENQQLFAGLSDVPQLVAGDQELGASGSAGKHLTNSVGHRLHLEAGFSGLLVLPRAPEAPELHIHDERGDDALRRGDHNGILLSEVCHVWPPLLVSLS